MKGLFFIIFISLSFICLGQKSATEKAYAVLESRGEVILQFEISDQNDLNTFSKIVSIDAQTKPGSTTIFAYANKKQFQDFIKLNIPFTILTHAGKIVDGHDMLTTVSTKKNTWDSYPTYQVYLDLMSQFQSDYQNLCTVFNIGNSVQGRKLLFVRLTTNSSVLVKPRIMLTSSMHGDELVGYVTLLHMIDYLLSNYGISSKATSLLDNFEIWINPLANPDGAYAGGNNTVAGATRFNANAIDLNRNFPDFVNGQHPDGNTWQPENIAMMHLVDSLQFVLSVNVHSGADVVNYPWDNKTQRHPDESWWQYIAKNYADTVFAYSTGNYFTTTSGTGYTNGSDWYIISGGRQDYMNFYNNCREFTLEISVSKIPSGSSLPAYWEANYRSLLNYMKESCFGFNGIVTDSLTGIPLSSMVTISGHDADNSFVMSELPYGNYYRPIFSGSYIVSFSANGYNPKSYLISASTGTQTTLNAQLTVGNSGVSENSNSTENIELFPNPTHANAFLKVVNPRQEKIKINIINLQGEVFTLENKKVSEELSELQLSTFPKGVYFLQIILKKQSLIRKVILN